MKLKSLDVIAAVLLVVGGLNWGRWGLRTSTWWPLFSE